MLKDKYLKEIARTVREIAEGKAVKAFVFGSSVRKDQFGDCDLGVMGEVTDAQVRALKERFVESTLPYKVDVINFNTVTPAFRKNVMSDKMIWILP